VHYFQSLAKRFDANAAPTVYLANVVEVRTVLPTKILIIMPNLTAVFIHLLGTSHFDRFAPEGRLQI
jgi:hypothetical protein